MRRRSWLLAVLCCAGLNAADVADVDRALEGLAAGVGRLRARCRAVAGRFPAAPSEGRVDGACRLVLAGALDGADLSVEAVRREGAFGAGRGVAPGWGPLSYGVDATGLRLEGDRLTGELVVDLVPWTGLPDHHPDRGERRRAVYAIDCDLAAGTGSAEIADPTRAPYPTGPHRVRVTWHPLLRPSLPATEPPAEATEYELACWWHARACRWWENARALELMDRFGLPWDLARSQVPRCHWSWPDLAAEQEARAAAEGEDELGIEDPDALLGELDAAMAEMMIDAGHILAVLEPMRAHLAAMEAALERRFGGSDDAPSAVVVGDASCPDPDFGPGSCSRPLEPDATGVVHLPADAGTPGPEDWVHLARWRCIGPFPTPTWGRPSPRMPDLVPTFAARLAPDREALARVPFSASYHGSDSRQTAATYYDRETVVFPEGSRPWVWEPARPLLGRFWPLHACKHKYVRAGKEWCSFYFVADIQAPAARELWAAVAATYAASLRVNGELVWRSGRLGVDPQARYREWLCRLPLRAGVNRLVLRLDESTLPVYAALRVCVRGGPREADAAAAAVAARRERYAGCESPYAGARQFRRDQSGSCPDAAPVLAWDLETGANVRWFSRGVRPSNAAPVQVFGDLVVTTEWPNLVVAVDAESGTVRWRRRLDRLELEDPDLWARVEPLWRRLDALDFSDPDNRELIDDTYATLRDLYPDKWRPPIKPTPGGGYAGRAMATPIASGDRLWVLMASELLACFDVDGERRWLVATGASGGSMGHHACSPVKHGDAIVVQLPVYGQKDLPPALRDVRGGWKWERNPHRRQVLRAFATDTGERLWTSRRYRLPNFGNRYDADGIVTPHLVRLSDGAEELDVLVTGGGHVFRAVDGELLLPHLGHETKAAPILSLGGGDLAIFSTTDYHKSGGYVAGVRLLLEDRDHVAARLLWTSRQHRATGYGGYVLHAGRLYGGNKHPDQHARVWALDAADGRILADAPGLTRNQSGNIYSSPAVAGGVLFLGCDARNRWNRTQLFRHQGHIGGEAQPYQAGGLSTVVPGVPPLFLARNRLGPRDGITFPPAFAGELTFIRLRGGLLCTGPNAAGAPYQAETVARTLLAQLQLSEPTATEPLVARRVGPVVRVEEPREERFFASGRIFPGFWCVGPMDPAAAAAAAGKLGAEGHAPWYRSEEHHRADELFGHPLRPSHRPAGDGLPAGITTGDFRYGLTYDLAAAHRGQAGTACWWVSEFLNERERVVRLDLPAAAAGCWIAGTAVDHNARIRLPRGRCLVAIRTDWDGKPATMRPRLWASDDPDAERVRRRARLARVRPYLERAVAVLPDGALRTTVEGALEP